MRDNISGSKPALVGFPDARRSFDRRQRFQIVGHRRAIIRPQLRGVADNPNHRAAG